jgi:hypothetical protein
MLCTPYTATRFDHSCGHLEKSPLRWKVMGYMNVCHKHRSATLLIPRKKGSSLRYYYSVLTLSKRCRNKCIQDPKWHSRKYHFCTIPIASYWSDSGFIVCRIWGQVASGVRKSIDWRLGVRKPTHGSLGDEEVVWDRRKWRREQKMSWGLSNDSRFPHLQSLSERDKTQQLYGKLKGDILCLILRARVYVFGCTINIDTFLLLLFISVYTKGNFCLKINIVLIHSMPFRIAQFRRWCLSSIYLHFSLTIKWRNSSTNTLNSYLCSTSFLYITAWISNRHCTASFTSVKNYHSQRWFHWGGEWI